MTTKLIINIETEVAAKAEAYAAAQGISLSDVVEAYLKLLTQDVPRERQGIDPLVDVLWGAFKVVKKWVDYKEVLGEALIEKYGSKYKLQHD